MVISRIPRRALILAGSMVLVAGCTRPHPGWEPPLQETSTRFLQEKVDEVRALVEAARQELPPGSDDAREPLSRAASKVRLLSEYYLPMLEARQRTYDAHRFFYYGETSRAETEIDAVETILDKIAEAGGSELFRELKRPLDLVGEAKSAMRGAPAKAPGLLKELAVELNSTALRADLVFPED